ncbi:P-loop containing nucleoside triphosphate hydrolase protein [Sporodiniella umbellata]|nr:P-loop containing nucleoside triphosphate hydrolase protein [Sporodiniella umbellata]
MTAELFAHNLTKFNITLEDDATSYIASMLNDMSLNETEEIKESTESFLIDANVNDQTRNDFYKNLFLCKTPKEHSEEDFLVNPLENKQKPTAKRAQRRDKSKNSTKEPELVATTQQSRFHTETVENMNKELDLHGVNISINQNDLLVDAHLKFKPCTRYGLVGQNGVGKSMLLKCLADNILVGLPQNLHILHISQLEEFDEKRTVLQEILESDKKVTSVLKEYNILHSVIGEDVNAKNSNDLNIAVFSILKARLREKVNDASKIATKRSGLRGREARKELIACEKEEAEFSQGDVTPDQVNDIIADIYERFGIIDQAERKQRAFKLLRGLGFSEEKVESCISCLSGGWRMRVALAKSLFLSPDILLLDEPTNHLDLPAILWLQEYLTEQTDDKVVVVVSHNRDFLNNVTEETIIFRDRVLAYHAGNYEDWQKNRDEQIVRKQALLDNTEKKKKAIQASIQRNAQQAKATGDDKRHGMINSRKKKLERLGMEKTEDGKRFKVSYRAGFHFNSRLDIVVEKALKTSAIKIPQPTPLRYHGPMLSMKSASFRYKGDTKDAIRAFSINIEPKTRIAFLGANGSGKTTLLNLLTEKNKPTSGEVQSHALLRLGYFSQNIVDQLDLNISPLEHMMTTYPILSEQECRSLFGSVGISGSLVLQSIRSLSGGQRSRIALAMVLFNEPHILVLDEITNHLDMGTVETLVEALEDYSGAVIVVSHDIWFLKQIFENECAEEEETQKQIFAIEKGHVQLWEKDINAYAASVLKKVKRINK